MIEAKIHKIIFSPSGDVEKMIVDQIKAAKKCIKMIVFWFTWKPIAKALISAAKRGVNIQMILDKRSFENKQKDVDCKNETLIPKFICEHNLCNIEIFAYQGELLHYKTILIDDDMVTTGSCNFFNASINRHEENYMLIESKELNKKFSDKFIELIDKSKRWQL